MSINITDKAMLVKLSISQWSARKHDKKATAAAEAHFGTSNAGRFNKLLIADEAIKKITKAVNEARTFNYENTLPWTDEGWRILPSAHFERYSEEMRKLRGQFEAAVQELVDNYDALVEAARDRLNGMFNELDYPRDIGSKFVFGQPDVRPIPRGDDFRVGLSDEETDRIRQQIEQTVNLAAEAAHADLYKRLYEAVGHVVERLNSKDAIFRDSLIGNLSELCQIIPALNVQDDPALEDIRKQVEKQLTGIEPQVLRDNPKVRKQTAKEAQSILDAMGGIYGS